MIIIYLIVFILLLWGISFQHKGIYEGYIGKEECNAIKGVFIVFVFCRHIWPYLEKAGFAFQGFGDELFRHIDSTLGQLIVVMFLFYSGYGVMESYKKKGYAYVDSMPKKRLLPTLLNFNVAVIVFLIVDAIFGLEYSDTDIVFAFTGWTSVGNSNWYIFVILMCYLATYIGLEICKVQKCKEILVGGVILALIAMIFIFLRLTKECHWYDTIFVYPFGACYSIYKRKIEEIVAQKYYSFLILAIILGVFWLHFPYHHHLFFVYGNVRAIFFVIMIITITMKIKLKSPALIWLGKILFPLYIYQRIGMIILSNVADGIVVKDYPYLYIFSCAALTILLGWSYRFIQIKIK